MDSEEEKVRETSPERREESEEMEDEAGDVTREKEDGESEEDEAGDVMGQNEDEEGEEDKEREDEEGEEDEAGDMTGQKEDEERGDVTGQMKDTEEWNGFLSGGVTVRGRGDEVVVDWKPGDPVTPQYVLTLAGYTQGEK